MKRAFDITVSLIGLICLLPLLVLVAILIKLESTGPIFFRQERMGREFRSFSIWKYRTMMHTTGGNASLITSAGDPRITRFGRILRKTKIDEIPQLINVLKGEMSLVGPRPEVRKYVEAFADEYKEILKVRPGITDLATLKYRNEERILAASADAEQEYVRTILPDKIRLAQQYISQASLLFDLQLVLRTLVKVFFAGVRPKGPVHEGR
jgi:lipopolysaccharide/colanic/teichoic acid biosynthesis glycosyltransferase